jgi:hypothetical protein
LNTSKKLRKGQCNHTRKTAVESGAGWITARHSRKGREKKNEKGQWEEEEEEDWDRKKSWSAVIGDLGLEQNLDPM